MEALFLKLLRMSLSASVLVLAVLVLRLVLRRAPKWTHVLLWALVALRLLCPFTVESSLSLQPQRTDELAQSIAGYAEFDARSAVGQDGAVPEAPLDSNALHTVTVPAYDRPQSQSAVPTAWTTYFSRAWLFGVGAMLLYALVSYVRLRRRVAASLPLEGNVFVCDGIDSPFILGIIRPRIYVPSALDGAQLPHVLAHERAHLKRRDHWWKPLGFLLLSIHWFNPVLWLAYVLLCRDIELACDERVYRDMALPARADYSQTLLDQSRSRHALSACPLAFGEAGVKDRVRAALSYKKPAFWVVVLALIACAVAAVCFLTNPEGLKIEFTRGDILGAETYHALTVEDEGIRSLNVNQIDALYDRLQDLPRITRPGDNAGHTPMYELTVSLGSGENEDHLVLRGYNTEGTMTEVAYRGKTWLVTDDDFSQYVRKLCEAADTEQVIRWSADLDGDGETEYFVLDASTLDTLGYAQFWLETPDGSKINDLGQVGTSHVGWGTLALTELDGKTYLMEYNPSMFQGEASYTYSLMELKSYGLSPVEHRELTFSANPGKSENNDAQAMQEFQDRANELWAHSRLLVTTDHAVLANLHNVQTGSVSDDGKGYYIAAPDEVVQYREVLIAPASALIVQYDTDVLHPDVLPALSEKYGFEAVRNFGRPDLFSAYFPEPLTVVAANEYIEALSAEPGILTVGFAESPPQRPDYDAFLLALQESTRIAYSPSYYSSVAYPPITDEDLVAELKELLTRVTKADGDPEVHFDGEGFTLDDFGVSYCVQDGYLVAWYYGQDGEARCTVIGTAPDGLMAAVRSAAQRQMSRNEARSDPNHTEFRSVMGLDGYYTDEELAPSHYQRTYFTERNGQMVPIAESFGFTIDDHVVDLDGDGVTELVCNCVYGGDGAQRVLVYRRSGSTIQRGSIDYAKVNLTAWDNWGANSTAERYNPELGVFLVKYASLASSSGDGTTSGKFLREVDYSAFAWENYAVVP